MTIQKIFFAATAAAILLSMTHASQAQQPRGPFANIRSIKCTFPVMAVGTWGDKEPEVKLKAPTQPKMQFDAINTDEGTAELNSGYGKYDIIVRYSNGYLHFIQSFLDGPLYTTTIMEKKTASGRYKAMHSRHEVLDFALIGFTSSPEQWYGDCEILQ